MSRNDGLYRFDPWADEMPRDDDAPGSLVVAAIASALALAGVRALAWLIELAGAGGGS